MKIFFFILILSAASLANAEGFVAGTLVKTPAGYTRIEELKVGDKVLSCDFKGACLERAVIELSQEESDQFLEIKVSGETIGVAYDHKFYDAATGQWVKASALDHSRLLMNAEYQRHALGGKRGLKGPILLYNISVNDHHNYYVSKADVLVHNVFPIIFAAVPLLHAIGTAIFGGVAVGIGIAAFMQQPPKPPDYTGPYRTSHYSPQKQRVPSQPEAPFSYASGIPYPYDPSFNELVKTMERSGKTVEADLILSDFHQKEFETYLDHANRLRAQGERAGSVQQIERADLIRDLMQASNAIWAQRHRPTAGAGLACDNWRLSARLRNRAIKLVSFAIDPMAMLHRSISVPPTVAEEFNLTNVSPHTFEGSEIGLVAVNIEKHPEIFEDEALRFQASTALHQAHRYALERNLLGFMGEIDRAWAVVDYARGMTLGIEWFVRDTADGIAELVAHPIDTAKSLYDAVVNYEKTFDIIRASIESIRNEYDDYSPEEKGVLHARIAAEILATVVPIGGVKNLAKVGKLATVTTEVVSEALPIVRKVTIWTTQTGIKLNDAQLKNVHRFLDKIPSNSKENISLRALPNNGIAVQAMSPGRVPGSHAIYEKQIDSNGKTLQFIKTTYDQFGKIIHAKDKISGEVVQ